MFKKAITKINSNIDKAIEYRNKSFMKILVLWSIIIACYFAHSLDAGTTIFYFIQFVCFISSIPFLIIGLFITYVDFVIVSKVEAVTFGGMKTRFVIDMARDKAVEKFRDIKDNKPESVDNDYIKNKKNL